MRGLDPRIHVDWSQIDCSGWIAGSSSAKTERGVFQSIEHAPASGPERIADRAKLRSATVLCDRAAAGLGDQPFRKFAHLRFSCGERRSDDEIRARSDQRLFERSDKRARLDQIIDQGLTAEGDALPAHSRLNHLLILAKVQRARKFEL